MKNTIRIPHAPTEPMPELAEFLRPFHIHFLRSEGRHALDRYLTGLLTELPNKVMHDGAMTTTGTPTQAYLTMLQMKELEVAYASVEKFKMTNIRNVDSGE